MSESAMSPIMYQAAFSAMQYSINGETPTINTPSEFQVASADN
jgi:hypothetical protein